MSLLEKILGASTNPTPSHGWVQKRTYDLPGPRPNPEVTVYECSHCGMVKETSNWHDPNPQYFEDDTREAGRVTDAGLIKSCPGGSV